MAKKRTLVPYYGKDNQSLVAIGAQLLKAGQSKQATAFFDKSTKLFDRRKRAGVGLLLTNSNGILAPAQG